MTVLSHLTGLAASHGKDLDREKLLAEINELLSPLEADLESRGGTTAPAGPVLILGPPRGGTTLVSQMLGQTELFGMVTNFVAHFWQAPALGMKLSRALGINAREAGSTYRSTRGQTDGWTEPSEFGYFWSRFFDLGQATHELGAEEREQLDREGLRAAVAAMAAEAGRPMAFKNNTWFTFQADLLAEIFPSAILVACRRDPFFVAQSLYLQRLDLYGNAGCWWSVRPPEHEQIKSLPPVQQVAEQAVRTAEHMEASLRRAIGATVVDAAYERLIFEPRKVVAEIAEAAGIVSEETEAGIAKLPLRFESTDSVRLPPETAEALQDAVANLSGRR